MEQEDSGIEVRRFLFQEVQGAFPVPRAIFAAHIVPELIGGHFGKEVLGIAEVFQIVEFGFNGAVDAFDIAIGVGAGRRDEAMRGAKECFDSVGKAAVSFAVGGTIELAAVVGLDNDLIELDAVSLEVFEQAASGQIGVGEADFIGVGQELGAAGEFAQGVLKFRQVVAFHLRPVVGQIGEEFHIELEVGEGFVGGFESAQILFALMLATRFARETVLAQDAFDSTDAARQLEFVFEAFGAEAWGALALR